MSSIVLIFLPCEQARNQVEAALRKQADSVQFIEEPAAKRSEPIEDVDQLPLWRLFTF